MSTNNQPSRATDASPSTIARPDADTELFKRIKGARLNGYEQSRIVEEAKHCTEKGEISALLRREGISSSSLSSWRRMENFLDSHRVLTAQNHDLAADRQRHELEITQLRIDRGQLQAQLDRIMLVIDVQKKVASLLPQMTLNDKFGSI